MDKWESTKFLDDFSLPHIFVIIIVAVIILTISLVYYFQNRNYKITDKPRAFSIAVEAFFDNIKALVVDGFGPRFVKVTPYFVFLFIFLLLCNIFAIFGVKEATTSYTVPLTLGFITWFSSIVFAIKYQRLSYFKKFCFRVKIKNMEIPVMINPISVLGEITPLISLTFRLWGNIIAGSIIYAVFFWVFASLSTTIPAIPIMLLGGIVIMPFLFGYLSLFIGFIQSYVFTLLSITYISTPIKEGIEMQEIKQAQKLLKQKNSKKEINENARGI